MGDTSDKELFEKCATPCWNKPECLFFTSSPSYSCTFYQTGTNDTLEPKRYPYEKIYTRPGACLNFEFPKFYGGYWEVDSVKAGGTVKPTCYEGNTRDEKTKEVYTCTDGELAESVNGKKQVHCNPDTVTELSIPNKNLDFISHFSRYL